MKYTFFLLLMIASCTSFTQDAQEDKTLWTAAWSPNDELVAIGGSQGELKLFDGKTFELLQSHSTGGATLSRLKWHPTQNKLAVITQSTTFKAKILDLDQNKWIELEGLENSLRGIDWNHSGELLAISEFEGEISIFDINGKRVSRFLADPKSVAGIDWHPTENVLAAVGSKIGIFTHLGDTIKTFDPRDVEVFLLCVEWHQSGEFFAVGDYGVFEDAQNKLVQFWS
ncbi:MAG: WD40 repeat domain-containing protein, partial [Bacteroidota bacterium]